MGFFSKIGGAISGMARNVVSAAKGIVSNPIVSTVGNIVAPGAFSAVSKAVNSAAGILAPAPNPAPALVHVAARIAPSTTAPRPAPRPDLQAPARAPVNASPRFSLGGLVEKLAPKFADNTARIRSAFRRA